MPPRRRGPPSGDPPDRHNEGLCRLAWVGAEVEVRWMAKGPNNYAIQRTGFLPPRPRQSQLRDRD
ncbi:hypothetical protein Acsp05_19050 [Actinokineospora sp. NBRC 105648]|nr:hypothetical protein Acsp05_19050 [Actinokineospora sp. NBRC 105648]